MGIASKLARFEQRGKLIIQAISIVRKLSMFDETTEEKDVKKLVHEAKELVRELNRTEDI